MCGIAGILSRSPGGPNAIDSMRDSLEHRGPDHGGSWTSICGRVALAHRRLAIVDLTPEANQPFRNSEGLQTIVFNGEIYNFRELKRELRNRGKQFHTNSDTEVLLAAYREWGEGCLKKLSGMFAFAIWDPDKRTLFCARDRVGEKPFYYGISGGAFLFASELKALTHYPGFQRKIYYPALIDYLCFGYVPDPKSIWEDCHKLAPGHSLSVYLPPEGPPQVSAPVRYWDMLFDPDTEVRDWKERILGTLESACREMSFADVPVGAFLSGGVDSSSVTAGLCKAGCQVRTFTVGFAEQEFDERPWARQVAELYRTAHTEKLIVPGDVGPVMKKILWHYDEPFNDYSYLPTYYLCREARQSITVALSGDGADELFAGYGKYRRLSLRQDIGRFMPGFMTRAAARSAAGLVPGASDRVLPYALSDMDLLASTLMTGFPVKDAKRAARGQLAVELRHYSPQDTVVELLRHAPPAKVGLVNAMRYLDLKLTLAGDMLVKVDRASMAVALEVRPVYLHRDILELSGRIPPRLLADRNQSKKLLKDSLRPWLPDATLYRPKKGLALPLSKWLNGDLRHMFDGTKNGSTCSPIDDLVDSSLLGSMHRAHEGGAPNLTLRIHSLMFLRRWLEAWA